MFRLRSLLPIAALALVAAAHPAPTIFDLSDEVGKVATPLTLTATDGEPLPLDGGGKPAYVFLFASWCEPCRESLPFVRAAYAKYGDRIRFVGVDVLEDVPAARASVAAADLPFPVAIYPIGQLDATIAPDVQLRSGMKYRIPADFLIDTKGVVRYAWHGLSVDDKGDPVDVLPGYLAKLGIE
jgi:thiol-disulfide isomerase/thioredoxin